MEWYYSRDKDQQIGPLTDGQFNELVASGAITGSTLVWNATLDAWLPYDQLGGSPAPAPAASPNKLKLAPKKEVEETNPEPSETSSPNTVMASVGKPRPSRLSGPSSIEAFAGPLHDAKGWMRLIGIMFIIAGAMYALTIVGLVVAWLPIWIGVALMQAAKQAEIAYESSDRDALALSLNKIRLYFKITGILFLIGIIMTVVMCALAVLQFTGLFMLGSM